MSDRNSNFEPFKGEFGFQGDAFLTEDDKVLWVENANFYEVQNPREKGVGTFITFDGLEGAADSPDPDMTPESLHEFAFEIGIPYPEIDPGFNEEGEYVNDVSYGELAIAQAELPIKILDKMREDGYTVLPVTASEGLGFADKRYKTGLPDPNLVSESFAGFIYTKDSNISMNDLIKAVYEYDSYNNDNTYKIETYGLTQMYNVETSRPEKTEFIYGYNTELNGFENMQDTSRYLGEYFVLADLPQKKDLETIVQNDKFARGEKFEPWLNKQLDENIQGFKRQRNERSSQPSKTQHEFIH